MNCMPIILLLIASEVNAAMFSKDLEKRLLEYKNEDQELCWCISDLIYPLSSQLNCLMIITDRVYNDIFQPEFFYNLGGRPVFKVMVKDYEDLMAPNYNTLHAIQQSRRKSCNMYIILLANTNQATRLLKFGDRYRELDTRAKFIMLHDKRLFQPDLYYLWKKIVNVAFVRKFPGGSRYEISTVPFPAPIRTLLSPKRLNTWKAGKFMKNIDIFFDKTNDLKNETLRVATFEHVPSVLKKRVESNDSMVSNVVYSGLEIEMLKSLSDAMNFEASVYEALNGESEAWGRKQLNGSYSGVIGEVETGRADLALGNFLHTPYYLKLLDLSIPYTTQCFTFLTPESTTDNSWKTLILPFKFYMWLALLLTLFASGFMFYGLAKWHRYLENKIRSKPKSYGNSFWRDLFLQWNDRLGKKEKAMLASTSTIMVDAIEQINDEEDSSEGLYLFDELDNSFLYTYGMVLLISLPKVPTGWALRMMTGWWWIYCLLVTVSYRASMTAILANPAQRVTIDTLEELATSKISCGGWGEQNKRFFTTSLDTAGQRVGGKFEVVYNAETAVAKVAKGEYAYYENVHFLRAAKVKQKLSESRANKSQGMETNRDLHIMGNCVINMPISLGLQKNSPLKPRVDIFLQRVIEAGLVKKWLNDVMLQTTVAEAPLQTEEIKALMDMKKLYAGIVALISGYILSTLVLIGEKVYWHFFVLKKPEFDKYDMRRYFHHAK